MPPPPQSLMTANEFLHVRIPEKRAELVRGKLVVREPAGLRHGGVAMDLARRLADHVDARGLGQVYAAETGFALARDPDTVRAPDIAFIRGNRLPDPEPTGFPHLAPDLVVEVLSPGDRPGERSEEHTSELQSRLHLVCRLLLATRRKRHHGLSY